MESFCSDLRHVWYGSKRMQQIVKFVHHFLIRNYATLLWFVREAPGYGIAALFAKCAAIQQMWHIFTAKGGTLWHFWWEKSSTHATMFSSAVAACL